MDVQERYNATIESIRSETGMKFNMSTVLSLPEEPSLGMACENQPVNLCRSAGCIIGHAIIACEDQDQIRTLFWNDSDEPMQNTAMQILRMEPSALHRLCYRNLSAKEQDREGLIQTLQTLRDTAAKRDVNRADVEQAEKIHLGIPY